MPTLNWIGKDKIINHHQEVPYKVLNHEYGFSENGKAENTTDSGNLILNGDNLEALKSLLSKYEGKVNCIYIDPPYNTGNENWVYNDNVNSPKIKKWLGKVVGKESEDLTRHDKWLCMMYPRLKLLHKLLAKDGVIFISIDDNEQANLKLMMDEIFGNGNFIANFIWKKAAGSQNDAKHIAISHEYIISFTKNKNLIKFKSLPLPEKTTQAYKFKDEYFETRGLYQLRNLNDTSIGDRPGLHYDVICPDGTIINGKEKQWRCDIYKFEKRKSENRIVFKNEKGSWQVLYKLYLNEEKEQLMKDNFGNIIQRGVTPNSSIENLVYNSDAGKEIKKIFNTKNFDYPKPTKLIEYFLKISTNPSSIILDSFAGSGTTAHAVLNLNKQDGGNRKFILIEMEDYAETITAERIKRVIKGYGENDKSVEGTGGSFDYYTLGEPLFDENNNLNENIAIEKIREYVWFTETRIPYAKTESSENPFMGKHNDTSYYFIYNKDTLTTLDYEALAEYVQQKAERYIIYADNCLLPESFLREKNIEFKKIPRDITRF